jgi:hypothetical protein
LFCRTADKERLGTIADHVEGVVHVLVERLAVISTSPGSSSTSSTSTIRTLGSVTGAPRPVPGLLVVTASC